MTAPADHKRPGGGQVSRIGFDDRHLKVEHGAMHLTHVRDGGRDLLIEIPTDSLDWKADPNPGRGYLRYTVVAPMVHGPKFTSSEKVVLAAAELEVETVADFRALLVLVLERSGLTCGQIAAKTSIGRSSVYNLADVRRTGLPTKPDQVQEFLCACGLQLRQVGTVMRSWELLDAERAKPTGKSAAAEPPPTMPITQLSPREILQEAVSRRGARIRDFAVSDIVGEFVRLRTLLPILLSIGLLVGWRYLNTTTYSNGWAGTYSYVNMWAEWPPLVAIELLVMTQLLRWRLRRTAKPRPRRKRRLIRKA